MVVARRLSALILTMLSGTIAFAALSIYMPPEAVADRAILIVEGRVQDVTSGYDPVEQTISTYITLNVTEVHMGPSTLEQLVIREPGGTIAGLSSVLDAVPVYSPGEHVFAFLEPSADGALRTVGMFFGKYTVMADDVTALRDLDGRGLIVGRPATVTETIPIAHLRALAAELDGKKKPWKLRATWSSVPPELIRTLKDPEPVESETDGATDTGVLEDSSGTLPAAPSFTPLSTSTPARCYEVDNGTTLTIDVDPEGNPLSDNMAAVDEMQRAMAAWTDVPESRITLQLGNGNADFTGWDHVTSPTVTYYPGARIILFDDPYEEISDPSNCSGVLAIGGYWMSGTTGDPVNDVVYNRILSMYVIFNNDFQCFLGDPDNLAEVATHELGHAIGLGHSTVQDAIMRSTAYGSFRGPRLGDDDMDAVHCIYPHTLSLTSPVGGESFLVGESRPVTWDASLETGSDSGEIDLEYSTDSGVTWTPLAAGTANDGHYDWTIYAEPGTRYRVRAVRYNRIQPTPDPYPSACSSGSSPADFDVVEDTPGIVPDFMPEPVMTIGKSGSDLIVYWDESGGDQVDGYAIYRGDLDSLRAGTWNHLPETCDAGIDMYEILPQPGNNSFYLIAPLSGAIEGNIGAGSDGLLRPESSSPCGARE